MSDLKAALEELVRPHGLGCGSIRVMATFSGDEPKNWKLQYFKVPAAKIDLVSQAAGSTDLDAVLLGQIGRALGYGAGSLMLEYQDNPRGPELHWLDVGRLVTTAPA